MKLRECFDESKEIDIACCYSKEEIEGFIDKLEKSIGIQLKSQEEAERD